MRRRPHRHAAVVAKYAGGEVAASQELLRCTVTTFLDGCGGDDIRDGVVGQHRSLVASKSTGGRGRLLVTVDERDAVVPCLEQRGRGEESARLPGRSRTGHRVRRDKRHCQSVRRGPFLAVPGRGAQPRRASLGEREPCSDPHPRGRRRHLYSSAGVCHQPSFQVEVADTIGAGDAF